MSEASDHPCPACKEAATEPLQPTIRPPVRYAITPTIRWAAAVSVALSIIGLLYYEYLTVAYPVPSVASPWVGNAGSAAIAVAFVALLGVLLTSVWMLVVIGWNTFQAPKEQTVYAVSLARYHHEAARVAYRGMDGAIHVHASLMAAPGQSTGSYPAAESPILPFSLADDEWRRVENAPDVWNIRRHGAYDYEIRDRVQKAIGVKDVENMLLLVERNIDFFGDLPRKYVTALEELDVNRAAATNAERQAGDEYRRAQDLERIARFLLRAIHSTMLEIELSDALELFERMKHAVGIRKKLAGTLDVESLPAEWESIFLKLMEEEGVAARREYASFLAQAADVRAERKPSPRRAPQASRAPAQPRS